MSFMLSPGVTVREWDLTQIIPQVATAGAAIVGGFEWGPLEKFSYVSDEEALVRQYGRPTDENFGYWFCAKNFLDYSRNLKVVRVVGEGAENSFDDLFKTDTITSYGGGIRWQVSEDKKLNLGVDVAVSNDDYTLYVQIGERY